MKDFVKRKTVKAFSPVIPPSCPKYKLEILCVLHCPNITNNNRNRVSFGAKDSSCTTIHVFAKRTKWSGKDSFGNNFIFNSVQMAQIIAHKKKN